MTEVSTGPAETRLTIATATCLVVAVSTVALSPLTVGGLIESFAVGEADAGLLITVELTTIGITSIALAPLCGRLSPRLMAVGAALLILVVNALTLRADSFDQLYLWRFMAGVGHGAAFAIANASIARSARPTALYSLAWASVFTVAAVVSVLITANTDVIAFDSVFRWMTGIIAVGLLLLWLLPARPVPIDQGSFQPGTIGVGTVLALGVALIVGSMMAYYAFVERLAAEIGASPDQAGIVVAIVMITSIIGAAMAAPVASRHRILTPLVAVSVLHALAVLAATINADVLLLGIFAGMEGLTFNFTLPLMFALAAAIDRQGRWAAAMGGVFTIATGCGPIIGGVLVETFGYVSVGWLNIACVIPATAAFIRVAKHAPGPGTYRTGNTSSGSQ